MSNLPYRQARKPTQYSHEFNQTWGPIWGILGALAAGAAFLLWPAAFFHGEKQDAFTGQEHWAWNASSTVACCVWWGLLVLAVVVMASIFHAANSPQVRALEKSLHPAPPDFPDLRHLHGNPFLDPPEGIHPPW